MKNPEYILMLEYLRVAEGTKYSYGDIKARFESEAAPVYGASMDKWIPDFAYANQLLLDSLAIYLPDSANAVDLGAGTGRLSEMLLRTFPDMRLTLVDVSGNMLREAEKRLSAHADRCEFIVHDIFDEAWEFPADSLDCVVSALAICHAQGIQVYERLYTRIHKWLKPRGYFVCYDHVRGDSMELTALNAMGWHRLLASVQTAEEAKDGIVGTYQEDSPLSLREHLSLLSRVGFSVADVLHKRDIFAVYAGVK